MPDNPTNSSSGSPQFLTAQSNPGSVVTPNQSPDGNSAASQPSTFTNMAPHEPITPPSRPRAKRALLFALVAALVLLGGSVLAFTVLRTSPEDQIKDAFGAMTELDTVTVNGALSGNSGLGGDFEAQIDSKDNEVALKLNVNFLTTTVKAELLSKGETAYLKLDGIREVLGAFLGGNPQSAALVSQLEGTYLRFDQDDVKELAENYGGQVPSDNEQQFRLSDIDKQKLANLLRDTDFFKVTERLGTKELPSTGRATGYKVVLDAEGVKQLMRGLRDVEPFKGFYANQSQESFEASIAEIKQSDFDQTPFEIWLRDGRLAQLAINLQEGSTTTRFELSFSRFNENVEIQEPSNSRPFSDVLEALLGGVFSQTSPLNLQLSEPTNSQ